MADFREAVHALGYSIADGPFVDGPDTVYRGYHLESGDQVALRLVRPGFDSVRFHKDAAVLTTFQHPGIANLREHRVIGAWSLLVLDWIEGETLERFMERRQSVSITEAFHLGEQLAAALDSLHSAGVVHPDFGPRSVVTVAGSGPRPDVKIIDLAICRKRENAVEDENRDQLEARRAPELSRERTGTAQTDQFIVASLIQELITGLSPFPEGDFNPTPLRKVKPLAPEELEAALLKALSKNPDDRFESMSEFITAARGRTNSPATPSGSGETAKGAPKSEKGGTKRSKKEATSAKKADESDKSGSFEFLKAGAAIATGVIIAVAGFFILFGGDEEATTREVSTPEVPFEATAANAGVDPILLELDTREAGFAESISCNAVAAAGFETTDVPANFYGDPDDPNRDRFVAAAGVDGTGALEVGDPGGVGVYGQLLSAEAETSYLISFNFSLVGEVDQAEVSIEWLNGDREVIGESEVLDLVTTPHGQHALISRNTPADTEFAAPRFFKSASPGLLFVDELIFVETESECTAAILG